MIKLIWTDGKPPEVTETKSRGRKPIDDAVHECTAVEQKWRGNFTTAEQAAYRIAVEQSSGDFVKSEAIRKRLTPKLKPLFR